ncbi:MAG TPA: DoxX family membrane protein [Candidatus Janibacter merdipullorum]|nr:DoxX family membrane protein [Candidatus Janibacter merdipullorum]
MTRDRVLDLVGLLARLVLGGALLVAGGLKVGNPRGAARAVQGYEIFPFEMAAYIGYALPWIEVVVGLLLVLGLFTRINGLIGALLMTAFVIGIAQAWARGLTIDCGCFGGGGQVAAEETRYGREIARDILFAACGAWLVVRPRTTYSLDRILFGDDKEQQ